MDYILEKWESQFKVRHAQIREDEIDIGEWIWNGEREDPTECLEGLRKNDKIALLKNLNAMVGNFSGDGVVRLFGADNNWERLVQMFTKRNLIVGSMLSTQL